MRILFSGERSGGHILAALVFCRYAEDDVYVFVPDDLPSGFFENVNIKRVGRKFPCRNIFLEFIFRMMEAAMIIYRIRPHVVIGMGGRLSIFIVIWGRVVGVRVFIYEPNVVMGRANRLLSRFVHKIYCGYHTRISSSGIVRIGVPVREEMVKVDKSQARKLLGLNIGVPVVLCVGGSRGSEFINNTFKKAVQDLDHKIQVIHITGAKQYSEIFRFYDTINVQAYVIDFCTHMNIVYSAADIIVSRAGAFTLAEIAYFGLPSVLIPHPFAGRHQWHNAAYFQKRKAAFLIEQSESTSSALKEALSRLITDDELRQKMGEYAQQTNFFVKSRKFYDAIREGIQ